MGLSLALSSSSSSLLLFAAAASHVAFLLKDEQGTEERFTRQHNLCKVALVTLSKVLVTSCNILELLSHSSLEAIKLATTLLQSNSRWSPLAILPSLRLILALLRGVSRLTITTLSPPSRLLIILMQCD